MKKIYLLLLSLFITIPVYATPSCSISAAGSSTKGYNVTATVTCYNSAAWDITISGSGATNGCSTHQVGDTGTGKNGTKSFSVTCYASSAGTIYFTAKGNVTGEDYSKINLNASRNVTIYNPRAASTNNNLGGLSIDGTDISPKFDPNVTEYTAVMPALTENIKVNGSVQDRYASIAGIGNVHVEDGANNITVTVTAENGAKKNYNIKVTVLELSPIIASYEDETFSVVRKQKDMPVKNDYYTESVVTINDDEVPSYYNEKLGYTLVGLKDENGNIELYKYNNGRYTKYNEVLFGNLYIEVLDEELANYTKSEFTYGDQVITSYQSNNTDLLTNKELLGDVVDDNYYLFYGVNIATGEKNLYQFDKREQTVQIFNSKALLDIKENADKYYYGVVIAVCVIIVLIILLIITNVRKNNKIKKLKQETKLDLVDKEEILNKEEIKELEKEDKEQAEKIEKTKEKFEEALIEENTEDKTEVKEEKSKKTKKTKKNSK